MNADRAGVVCTRPMFWVANPTARSPVRSSAPPSSPRVGRGETAVPGASTRAESVKRRLTKARGVA